MTANKKVWCVSSRMKIGSVQVIWCAAAEDKDQRRPAEQVVVQPNVETLCETVVLFGGLGMEVREPTCPDCLEILGLIEPRKKVA